MNWCFGLVNNRLTEIYFDKNGSRITFIGHAYVTRNEYSKLEQRQIDKDLVKHRYSYRLGRYKNKVTGKLYVVDDKFNLK